jgi:hypothetical protein
MVRGGRLGNKRERNIHTFASCATRSRISLCGLAVQPALTMPKRGSDALVEEVEVLSVEHEDAENVPPTGRRRSQRARSTKSAFPVQRGILHFHASDVAGEDEDEDEDEVDHEDEDDQDDEPQPKKRARKNPSSQPKTRQRAKKTNGVSKAKKPRKSRNGKDVEMQENSNESPMLGNPSPFLPNCVEALLDEQGALETTVVEWIERYQENASTAMAEMVNFILQVYSTRSTTDDSAAGVPSKSVLKTSTMKTI